ncbi:MAG: hypothetical protein WBB28_20830 [Crinalium sp.]
MKTTAQIRKETFFMAAALTAIAQWQILLPAPQALAVNTEKASFVALTESSHRATGRDTNPPTRDDKTVY